MSEEFPNREMYGRRGHNFEENPTRREHQQRPQNKSISDNIASGSAVEEEEEPVESGSTTVRSIFGIWTKLNGR